jgi:ferredoxin
MGEKNNQRHPARLAPGRARRPRQASRATSRANISTDMSFLEMLDVINGPRAREQGTHRLRSRLPRRHLRLLRRGGQRRGPRAAEGHHPLPAPHAPVPQRRRHHRRALPRERVPRGEGPRRRPLRLRPHHPGRRLRLRAHRPGPDAHCIPVPKPDADAAMDAAACIGCGACVAACPNASASLFTAAKVTQLAKLPQGHPERKTPRPRHGPADGHRGLRLLLQTLRVRSRLPQGNQGRKHRQHEPRIHQGPRGVS